jgi:hypothetical protein
VAGVSEIVTPETTMGEDDYWDPGYDEYPDPDTGGDVGTIEDDPGSTVQGSDDPNTDDGSDQDYYDNGDGTWTGADGIVYDDNLNVLGVDLGDGTFASLDGEIFDAQGNSLGYINPNTADESPGFWSGLGKFLSGIFGGSGSGGGGGFGGGATGGQSSMAQKAQQLGQQLAQARAAGASAADIAALQRQLAVAQLALQRGGGIDTNTILIGGALLLGFFAIASSRRNNSTPRP